MALRRAREGFADGGDRASDGGSGRVRWGDGAGEVVNPLAVDYNIVIARLAPAGAVCAKSPMIVRKTPAELEKMRQAGLLVWRILQKMKEMAAPGVTTLELESDRREDDRRCGRQAGIQGLLRAGGGRGGSSLCCALR